MMSDDSDLAKTIQDAIEAGKVWAREWAESHERFREEMQAHVDEMREMLEAHEQRTE